MFIYKKKFLFLLLALGLLVIAGYFLWEKSKSVFIKHKIAELFLRKSDSLYSIQYDSLFFDKNSGDAYFTNIHVVADTLKAKGGFKNQPYALLDIQISSLSIKGMHTDAATKGQEIIADSITINHPRIVANIVRKVHKDTKIDSEARNIYHDMFHKLKLIQISEVIIKDANVHAVNFWNKQKQFDMLGANLLLHNVRIDSAQHEDTSRLLFCKRASFHANLFTTYNRNREELSIKTINYSSEKKNIALSSLQLNRFASHEAEGVKLLESSNILIAGIDNFQVIKKKNVQIDSIYCGSLKLSLPLYATTPTTVDRPSINDVKDTVGFSASYGFNIHSVFLPDIQLAGSLSKESGIGKFVLKAHNIKANQLSQFQYDPMSYLNDIDIKCAKYAYLTADKFYRNTIEDIAYNSSKGQLRIGTIRFAPQISEEGFANKFPYQKDRYDVSIRNVLMIGPKLKLFLDNKIFITSLTAEMANIKIYRDLSKPLEPVSKIGSYPHQVLIKSSTPIDIRKVLLNDVNIQYKENNTYSHKHGIIKFNNSTIALNNVTNIPSLIRTNNICLATFDSKAIENIPLSVTFKFPLNTTDGHFDVKGSIDSFDMKVLNQVSRSLAALEIEDGFMHEAQFEFSGNDHSTSGHLLMKYDHLKVALLKQDAAGALQKRGFITFFANMVIKNDNPHKGKLRDFEVQYDRDEHKSFFNLVWRTIFTGMKATVGLPGPKIK